MSVRSRIFKQSLGKQYEFCCSIHNTQYSGDLNSKLFWHSNGPKQFARQMVGYSNHGLNSKLIVRYSGHRVFD